MTLSYCNYFVSQNRGDFNEGQGERVFHKNPELPS